MSLAFFAFKDLPMQVTCDKCKKQFEPKIQITRLDDGGELWSMVCPNCRDTTKVASITTAGVQIRERIQRLQKTGGSRALIERLQAKMRSEVSR